MKKFKWGLLSFAALVVILSAATYFFLRQSLAPLDGTLSLKNLSAEVTVHRDAYGIPHIKAANKKDALRALGFVMTSERWFQMELSKRMTHGELSEVFGEIALPADKLYRSLKLKKSVLAMIEKQKAEGRFDQEQWAEMEAYFDGVNQYIASHPRPYEMALMGMTPRFFEPIDAYIMTGHMAYSFGIAIKADPLMTELAQKLARPQFQNLRNDPIEGEIKIIKNEIFKGFQFAMEGVFTPYFEGSNAWLVGPGRSQSGKSLFANDPHIGYSMPAVWVEAHIETPEFNLYGHYLPLVPFAVLGHNENHAWGFTMSLTDDMDLYRETINKEQKTALFKDKPIPYKEWQEVIKVKNAPDVVLDMIETQHGPLLDHILETKDLALKWAFHRPDNDPIKALRLMAESKSLESFEAALKPVTAPGLNVMYADATNIAWWTVGDIAIKGNPHSDLILNGSSGNDEYTGYLEWNKKPQSVNPEEGFIVTANSRPHALPHNIRGDFQSDDRFNTIEELLSEKDIWNIEDFKKLQTRNFNTQTQKILNALFESTELSEDEVGTFERQLKLLKDWDFHSEIDSEAALLYHEWNNQNILLLLQGFGESERQSYLHTPYAWAFYERVILDPSADWWQEEDRNKLITEGLQRALNKYADGTTWGEQHIIEYQHPLGRGFPLNAILNVGPFAMPGAYNEINNNKMRGMGGDFKVVAGPSTRRLIDYANPQTSWGINPIGISGHLLSPFYDDQAQMFLQGSYREQWMNWNDIEKVKTHTLILKPE